jgi:hypothetical protein
MSPHRDGRVLAAASARAFALSLAFLAAGGGAAAQGALPSAAAVLGAEAYGEALAGRATSVTEDGRPRLLPSIPAAALVARALSAESPAMLVESLFLLPRAAPPDEGSRRAEAAAAYGLMRSFSSLAGIEYYSASRGAMRVFYEESYLIDGPVSRRALADPPAPDPSAPPRSETLFAFHRDTTFGANVYEYRFSVEGDAVLVESSNVTAMRLAFVPVIAPRGLRTWLVVYPASDAILFYAASVAKAPGLLRGRLGESFANRAEALFKWFRTRFGATGASP